MTDFNYRGVFYCILIVILGTFLLVGITSADNETVNISGYPVYNETLHIQNGQCVPINSTLDISTLGWGVPYLTYYGRYADDFDPGVADWTDRIALPNTATKLSNFYIDPSIFGNKYGFWYQNYNQDIKAGAGNYRMFYVNETCPKPNKTIYGQVNVTMINTTTPEKLSYLPDKWESDILLARGDYTSYTAPNGIASHVWIFGRVNSIYDYPTNQNVLPFNADQWKDFEPGNYDLAFIDPGKNGIMEEQYDPAYKPEKYYNLTWPAIVSPFRSIAPVNINGLQPRSVEEQLKERVASSFDDNITVWHLAFQEPAIQIKRVDAISNPVNKTWYNVRGYINQINGTKLSILIDGKNVAVTTAEGLDGGTWRQFNVMVPVDYRMFFPGPHDLEVSSGETSQIVQIYIYKEIPAHYQPPQYTEYFGTSPFVTPKIITVTVTVPVPGPVVTITIPPSKEQIHAEAQNVVDEQNRKIVEGVIVGAGVCLLLAFFAWIAWSILRAKRGEKK